VYWTETYGGQLLSGPKLIKSCSVYQEEEVTLIVKYLKSRKACSVKYWNND